MCYYVALVGLQVVNLWSPFFTAGSRPSFGSSASGPPPPPRRPTASPLVQYSRRGLRPWSVISPPPHKSALIIILVKLVQLCFPPEGSADPSLGPSFDRPTVLVCCPRYRYFIWAGRVAVHI